jgi:hypothetical protein
VTVNLGRQRGRLHEGPDRLEGQRGAGGVVLGGDATGLAQGMQRSLHSQLLAASASFAAGHTAEGVSQLAAFLHHLSLQRGEHIEAALDDAWVALAQHIIDAVG